MKLKLILLLLLLMTSPKHAQAGTFFDNLFNWNTPPSIQTEEPNPFSLDKIRDLRERLKSNIFGQDEAIDVVISALENYANDLNDPNKPIAAMFFYGPVGVGKTELALEIGRQLFGTEEAIVNLDMSDYCKGLSDLSRLIGTSENPKKGDLTSRIQSNPKCVVLLDNFDKASFTALSVFKQIFRSGYVTDGSGLHIDCRQCLFIATSNLGSKKLLALASLGKTHSEILGSLSEDFEKKMGEIYYELEPVQFNPLSVQAMNLILKRSVSSYLRDIKKKINIHFLMDQSVIQAFEQRDIDSSRGASKLKDLLYRNLGSPIVNAIKRGYLNKGDQAALYVQNGSLIIQKVNDNDFLSFDFLKEKKHEKTIPFRLDDLLNLENSLNEKVLGQSEPIKVTVATLIRYAAGIKNGKGPIASLLYLGPTGVGKTQLAKEIAIALYGSESNLVRLDMSEYSEPHSVSRLIGSPPGYINHEEGGQLTEALKKNPYAIVLLDEIEKAHTNVLRAFLQVFDEGHLSDAKGEKVDCSDAIFILTTNLGAQTILQMSAAGGYTSHEIVKTIQSEVIQRITPELYNRVEPIAFMGLPEEAMNKLIQNMLEDVFKAVYKQKQIAVEYDHSVDEFLQKHGFDYELGARPLKRLIQNAIVTPIAKKIVSKEILEGDKIKLSFIDDQLMIFINSND